MLTKFLGTGLARMGISLSVILFSLNVMAAAYPYMESISINGYALSEGGSITVEGFEVGDTIKLRIGVRNTGDQPSPPAYNNITVSFPSYTSSGDVTRVAVDSVNTSLNLNYSEYYGSGLGGDGYAEYVMVESVSLNTWQVDEDRYLELYIEPDDYGTFVINYRAAMSDQRSWTSGWSFNPPSGVVTDCLSFPTYTISVILPDPIPGQNHAPSKASNPQPSHDSSNASLYVHLDWNDASDPDGDSVGYEVYFGTNGSPGSEEYKGTMPTSDYDPGILQYNTDYYWRIDTTDGDLTTTGDVWHFKTQAATFPPGPELLSYVINKTDVQVNEAFTITVQGRNKGTSTAPCGGIAVQVRQVYSNGVEATESHVADGAIGGQSVWWAGDRLGTGHAAAYLHVESTWVSWTAGSQKTVQVTITPKTAGAYDVYCKMYLYDGSGYPRDPSGSEPNTDHQGEGTIFVGSVQVADSSSPASPVLTNHSIDKSNVQINEPFTVTVGGRNAGGITAPSGGMVVQVRQAFSNGVEATEDHVATGAEGGQSVWWAGDQLDSGDTAQYLQVQPTWTSWAPGIERTVQVTITPKMAGVYDIYCKMYLDDGSVFLRDPSGSEPNTDHQGEATILVGSVQVTTGVSRLIPILAYHKVDDSAPTAYWVTTERFDRQMAALKAYGFDSISLEDIHDFIYANETLPEKPVVITFDDGYQNFFTKAFPILRSYGFTATNFIITGYIGTSDRYLDDWETDPVESQYPSYHLLWSEIEAMWNEGITFGSHSRTHPNLFFLSDPEAEEEILGSKLDLENQLGAPVDFFAYPYGSFKGRTAEIVQEAGYEGAVTNDPQLFDTLNGDVFQMDRIEIGSNSSVDFDASEPENFFMTKVDPNLQVPLVEIDSISYLDAPTAEPISEWSPCQNIVIRVVATNTGPEADVIAGLKIDNSDHTDGLLYDSHQADPSEDIFRTFAPGQEVFDWPWQAPCDAGPDPYYLNVGFHDDHYVLGYAQSEWIEALSSVPGEGAVIVSRSVDSRQVALEQPFFIEVKARNNGPHAFWGGISISFPEILGNGIEAEIINDGSTRPPLFVGPLEPSPFNMLSTSSGRAPAQYMLAEMEAYHWERGETKTMKIKVVPHETGSFHVNIRFALSADPGYTMIDRDPANGPPQDQQGFPVYQDVVEVTALQ